MITPSTFFPGSAVQQIGYATTDIEEAVRRYRERYGIRNFLMLPDTQTTIAPGLTATVQVALAFVKDTMIEFIQPDGGADAIYREHLPASGYAIRPHHFGYAIFTEAEWEAKQREVAARKIRVALEGEAPGVMRYQYLDVREDVGHYLEYLYYQGDGGRQLLSAIPRND